MSKAKRAFVSYNISHPPHSINTLATLFSSVHFFCNVTTNGIRRRRRLATFFDPACIKKASVYPVEISAYHPTQFDDTGSVGGRSKGEDVLCILCSDM